MKFSLKKQEINKNLLAKEMSYINLNYLVHLKVFEQIKCILNTLFQITDFEVICKYSLLRRITTHIQIKYYN